MPRPFARVAPTCALITVALSFSPSSAQSPPAPSSADARLRVLTRCGAPAGWSSTPAFISFGWTREQAMSYLRDRAPLAEHEITTEIDRQIAWPAQALAYKLGELQIRRHRREAEEKLGAKFDQRRFHDAILAIGSVPLPVLAQHMERFIADESARVKE